MLAIRFQLIGSFLPASFWYCVPPSLPASGGTIKPSCRTRHSERSEESWCKLQVRKKALNTSRQEGGRLLIKMAPLMIKPSKPPQGARGKQHNRASPVGNAPLLPPVAASSPEGQISPMLTCRDMWHIAQHP